MKLNDLDVTKIATTVTNGTKTNVQVTPAVADITDSKGAITTGTSLVKDGNDKYFVKTGAGADDYFAATLDNKTGKVTFDSTAANKVTVTGAQAATVGRDLTLDTQALKAAGDTMISYKESGETKYAIKESNGDYKEATINATTGAVTKGTNAVTPDISLDPLKKIDDALSDVDKFRSSTGAVQNRFESAVTNLGNTVNNLSSARSRIEDSDYATEVSNMSRAQILQQAGTSVLAQANQTTQNVLSLLR